MSFTAAATVDRIEIEKERARDKNENEKTFPIQWCWLLAAAACVDSTDMVAVPGFALVSSLLNVKVWNLTRAHTSNILARSQFSSFEKNYQV